MILTFMNVKDEGVHNEYLAVILSCFIYYLCGVHTGWTSPSIAKLQSQEYPFEVSNEEASYIAILGPFGDIVGEISYTIFADRIGRKNTLLLAGVPMISAWILIYLSHLSPFMIYAARFLGGICMGTVISVSPMYTSEISRPEIRGKLGVISVFAFMSGVITINLFGKFLTIHQSSLIFIVVVLVFFATFSFMPKSPYYLLIKGRKKAAEESLMFFRRTHNVTKEVLALNEDVNRQLSEPGSFRDLFTRSVNKRALKLMIFGRIFQQLTGATALTMYGQHLLQGSSEIIEPQFAITIISICQACCVVLCGSMSDQFGRVPLLVYTTGLCSLNLLLLGIYFTLRDFSGWSPPSIIPVLVYGIYFLVYQTGTGSLLNVLLGEMFSASVKPKAICVVNITYSLVVLFTTKFYQISYDYLHISIFFYIFGICTFVGTLYFKHNFPETKGKGLEQIQIELGQKGGRRRSREITRGV
ncbi:facilitated trehalose transporter Tret1-like [Coccinella septempunctata]|uniref:facilitated trehalose transporter Tret1-like n=1 Tax=Coccinella septempunctata TaxID=41139 RepID=UPI001D093B2C|nr:facilitated trehalose transporter Tret1-like [Coccinella septempunctata]